MIFDPNANLRAVFAPKSIAVIGASERPGSVGRAVFERLITRGFAGSVYPVTPSHDAVLGVPAFATIVDVPERVDLVVIVTPAATVPDIVGACADASVKGAVIISAGFRETGAAGAELERRIAENARARGMRIVGPNCLGIIVPAIGLDTTFAADTASAGSIGFVSQSGALCTAILDWAASRSLGFSTFVSAGSMVDVGWSDYLDLLVDDPRTTSILLYMESVGGDASAFVSAAREAAAQKPLIIMKSGRSEAAARAAASHTGALLGSDVVFDAALRRCGALRVDSIQDLFDMADVLAKGNRPPGKRLAIVTNAGGPGVIAADALIAGGGELAPLAPESTAALDIALPAHGSRANPIDILGDADAHRYERAVRIALADPTADAVLVLYAPQAVATSTEIADALVVCAVGKTKPLLAAWIGGAGVAAGAAALERASISTYPFPELAVGVFNNLWRYDENLRALYETPAASDVERDRNPARLAIAAARAADRSWLSPEECSNLAAAYDIPLLRTAQAQSADEAVRAADDVGYPVAVKLRSSTVVHKTDVGGVRLNVADAAGVQSAYEAIRTAVGARAGPDAFEGVVIQPMLGADAGVELILGCAIDPQFGPVIAFGLGGIFVEVFHDRALGFPPLNSTLARRQIESTRAYLALGAMRGRKAVDLDALAGLLVRLGDLVLDNPDVLEIEFNPLYASAERIAALDVRVRLHDPAIPASELPKPAIRPYPVKYVDRWIAPDGARVLFRPIRAQDEPAVREFQRSLSDTTVYQRYAHFVALDGRIAHARLARSCFIDYGREIALVAESDDSQRRMLGIGNLVKSHAWGRAEFALLVADKAQGRGIGTEMLRRLIGVGRDEGVTEIVGYVLPSNIAMLGICARLGFEKRGDLDDGIIQTVLRLK